MVGVHHFQQTQSDLESLHQAETQRLAVLLANFRKLRGEEKKLRARVAFLEKQAAGQGPLRRGIDLVETLQEEQAELRLLREDLAAREAELEAEKRLPPDASVQLRAGRLEERISDLKARQEQVALYQGNVHYLEEKLALIGTDARLDIFNELKLSQQELAKVEKQMQSLEARLVQEWNLSRADLPRLDEMNDQEIEAFAREMILQREEVSRADVAERVKVTAKEADAYVQQLLRELRDAAYPEGTLSAPAKSGHSIEVKLRRADTTAALEFLPDGFQTGPPKWKVEREIRWSIHIPGTFAAVEVLAVFDSQGHSPHFDCVLVGNNGKVYKSASANLDRNSLQKALKDLHTVPKKEMAILEIFAPSAGKLDALIRKEHGKVFAFWRKSESMHAQPVSDR